MLNLLEYKLNFLIFSKKGTTVRYKLNKNTPVVVGEEELEHVEVVVFHGDKQWLELHMRMLVLILVTATLRDKQLD